MVGQLTTSGKWDFTYFYFTTLFLLKHLRSLIYTMGPKFPSISIVFPSKFKILSKFKSAKGNLLILSEKKESIRYDGNLSKTKKI